MAKAKLQDVADRAGVSITTVSRVLNDRGYLSTEIRVRVQRAIEELDYRPNELARSLVGQKTWLVGLIVPTVADPFFGQIAAELEGALAQEGYRLLLCNCLQSADRESHYLDLLMANRVDGIVTSTHNSGIGLYRNADLPIVAIDRDLDVRIPNVRGDNLQGGRMATERLFERGARRILHITATESEANLRSRGYREVLAEHGLEPRIFAFGYGTPVAERRAAIEHRLDEVRPDGVFCSDDTSAAIALEWARRAGVAVPDRLRIVGYDGADATTTIMPGLTTVRQPISDLASQALTLLLERIAAPEEAPGARPGEQARQVVLPVTLHEGWTA